MKINMHFSECEHQGDLDWYIEDINNSGGEVASSEINHEAETAEVVVCVDDMEDFTFRYRQTNSAGFEHPAI